LNINDYISSGILEAYLLDDLSEKERYEVELNLSLYPELRTELGAIEEAQEMLLMKSAMQPRAAVKKELFEKIDAQRPETKVVNLQRNAEPMLWKYAVAASITMALISSYLAYNYRGKWMDAQNNLSELLAQNQRVAQDYNQVNQRLDKIQSDLNIIDNPAFQRVVLKGTPNAPEAMASVYWNQSTQEVYISLLEMKKLTQDKQFQLWAEIDGKMVDAGVFDSNIAGLTKMKQVLKTATAFGITIEPRGGNETPTLETIQVFGKPVKS
jgi:anti-sigma-K factor RskA